jgi:predicted RNA-binding protein YlqC (UPF0109 family)
MEMIQTDVDCRPLEDKALLVEVARALVGHPEDVEVIEDKRGDHHVLMLYVRREDRGRVVGKRGRTIAALRSLFTSIGAADGRLLVVELQG